MSRARSKTVRQWIDTPRVATPQGFPLDALAGSVAQVLPGRRFVVHKCSGYGPDVLRLAAATERDGSVPVGVEELTHLMEGTDQWFYDIEVSCDGPDGSELSFGLDDSSSMFLEGGEELVEEVLRRFEAEINPPPDHLA